MNDREPFIYIKQMYMKGFFDLEENCKEKIISEDYWDFIIPLYRDEELKEVNPENACIQEMDFGYKSVSVDRRILLPLSFREYWYSTIPKCYTLLDMQPLDAAGIITLQNYPTLQLMGDGIMIGFLDTGIDYQNRVFRNLDGTTRIVGIWDQTIQTGRTPQGLYYGTEYTEEMINAALRSEDPLQIVPSVDTDGHGTFVASAAAGGAEVGKQFLGAAPEASIAMVKLKPAKNYLKEFFAIAQDAVCYQENDIMAGIQYLVKLADRLQLPLVLCLALGSNQGDHMGYTPLDISLQNLGTVPGIASVTAAGNEAGKAHHYFGSITGNTESASVEILVPDGCKGFFVELWCFPPELFSVGFRSPSGEVIPRVPARLGQMQSIPFFLDRTRIELYYEVVQSTSGSQLIFLRFVAPTPGIWTIQVYASGNSRSEFHLWLPISGFISTNVTFLTPDSYTTITAPGNSVYVITAGAYDAYSKSIYLNSSRGYTRNLQVKPDLCAPGVNVTGPGARDRYIQRDGTSAAAALTAGSCALLMEWGRNLPVPRYLSTYEMKNLLIRGAARNQDLFYPNREWGYGTLDVYQVFRAISTT